MKTAINYVLSFIIFALLIIVIVFNVTQFSISKRYVTNYINKSNYSEKVFTNIQGKIDEFIFNKKLQQDYLNFLSKDLIKSDIIKLINNNKIDNDKELSYIIKNYSNDEEIIDNYNKQVNDIYQNNLFPILEFKLLSKYFFGFDKIFFIDIILFVIISFSFTGLSFINRNFYYHKISFLSLSISLILGSIFIKIIFHNFNYLNYCYTAFFLNIINFNFIIYLLIGIIIIAFLIILNLHKKLQ